MSRFCFCNCPAGFSAEPERHAPDCLGRSGAGKARTPVPATTPALTVSSAEELDAVLHWRNKHAQAIRERDALQQRLTAADERVDILEGLVRRTLEYFTESGMPEDLLAEFKAALTRVAATCTWQYGAFSWHTSCDQEWMLNDGTPEQNGMHFCHSCGKTLVVEETEDA